MNYIKNSKAILYHVDISRRYFFLPIENRVLLFARIKAKEYSGAPNENIVQNHLNIALLNVFQYLNGRYRHIFIP